MKTRFLSFLSVIFMSMAGVQSAWAQKVQVNLVDDRTVEFDVSQVRDITFVEAKTPDTKEWVDLELPSGTLWATCNVGASKPEEYGDFFAWAETKPKAEYKWSNYDYNDESENCKGIWRYTIPDGCEEYAWYEDGEFNGDNMTQLELYDDAAWVNWGEEWQMPSPEQFNELMNPDYTTTKWTKQNGVNGYLITSKGNGKSIFLPAAGSCIFSDHTEAGSVGSYWSRSLATRYTPRARNLIFNSEFSSMSESDRCLGKSVRPVRVAGILVTEILMSPTELEMEVGDVEYFEIEVLPEDAANTAYTMESSDETVATVDKYSVTAVGPGTCTITCRATDGSGVYAECHVTVVGTVVDHDCVDLALPSGTLWATCNIGADNPEDYGGYFAWGETEPKDNYTWGTYKWMTAGQADWSYINKYTFADGQTDGCWYSGGRFVGDNKQELDAEDDAAKAFLGSSWQIPTIAQIYELLNDDYTTAEWTVQNGVSGRKVTSKKNGNSIFLPAAGWRSGASTVGGGTTGYYWSNSLGGLSVDCAFPLNFDAGYWGTEHHDRFCGHPIRPVHVVTLVSEIVLTKSELTLKPGDVYRLTATVSPSDASNKAVKWESSDQTVATVNYNGYVTALSAGTCTITCSAADGSGVKAECAVTVSDGVDPDEQEYVDLDLPSGTLWATCNVGASSPEEYGDYFAWGETKPKSNYTWNTYFDTQDNGNTFKKYKAMGQTVLLPEDDAATVNCGSDWQMPSISQIKELIDSRYTNTEWTTQNGVKGMRITGNNGKSIFLPAAGFRGTSLNSEGSTANYWSRSLNTSCGNEYADYLYIEPSDIFGGPGIRYVGYPVRPVKK